MPSKREPDLSRFGGLTDFSKLAKKEAKSPYIATPAMRPELQKAIAQQRAREERQIERDLNNLPEDVKKSVVARVVAQHEGKPLPPARVGRVYQNPPNGSPTPVYRGMTVDGRMVIDHFPEWPYEGER